MVVTDRPPAVRGALQGLSAGRSTADATPDHSCLWWWGGDPPAVEPETATVRISLPGTQKRPLRDANPHVSGRS
jgi:hypothetical protein